MGLNLKYFGDAILETSYGGSHYSQYAWSSDLSYFPRYSAPFFVRGGYLTYSSGAGAFAFIWNDGNSGYARGFCITLVAE